ncbi:MAG: hypothetical protein GQ535_07845 [Rhodobacteraceae bacterium]|nr:hypothetical protein [Paracoccaceae bacterium]
MILMQRILIAALLVPAIGAFAQEPAAPLTRPDLPMASELQNQASTPNLLEWLFGSAVPEATLTPEERAIISDAIFQNWDKSDLKQIENFGQYVVRVVVQIGEDGRVESVSPHTPSAPLGAYAIAYQAALSAVMTTDENGGIPLPMDKFPVGVTLVLRFDPSSGEIRLS